jgi:hypothetical protein
MSAALDSLMNCISHSVYCNLKYQPQQRLPDDIMEAFYKYPWPGNINPSANESFEKLEREPVESAYFKYKTSDKIAEALGNGQPTVHRKIQIPFLIHG